MEITFKDIENKNKAIDGMKKTIEEQQKENELINADKELLQSKWEAQGLMIQKLHEENGRYGEAVKLALMTLEDNNLMNDEYKRIHAILDGNGNLDTPEFLK